MSRLLHALIHSLLGAWLLLALLGCRPQQAVDEPVLRVGIIASLQGPARPWGLATVRCAQVIADYHNERGGFELEGRKVKIELVIKDDAYDASQAAAVAHDLILEGVDYVIGPLGDAQVSAAARVLDSSGVFYVHYGFDFQELSAGSLAVQGMPLPVQSLPVLFKHLREKESVHTALIMAYNTEDGVRQKGVAEQMATAHGLELLKLSRFDVSEETFGLDLRDEALSRRVERVVQAGPDALILAGCPPESFIFLVDRLRSGGFTGFICAQNFQDASSLAMLGKSAEGVFYVGGVPSDDMRSEYYESLKARYLDLAQEWSEEADTKFYALEFILACLQDAGLIGLEDTSVMYRTLEEIRFKDPFYVDQRMILVTFVDEDNHSRQIRTPIRISKMSGGEALLVEETRQAIP